LGGFKVQGKTEEATDELVAAAKALESAGAAGLVLELVPNEVGKRVTEAVSIPVIGIGAGPFCSGQILNLYDMLDIYQGRKPKFVKNFMTGAPSILDAVKAYASEVKSGAFPAPEHCF
jgi:3-methyl-2-oxobutanoate hydroxymethyltransferase